ncbi:uncharacterized protein BP01DRAFT_421889 [Aspergillus saccharolyticus JOP 1030-1]|uniref:Uncharacterized protein n=1 Tax=Aspergillus saccharolyticus JOP 1030-1 TaxID=1450539 RepID=A0A319AM14_9EURO|nr:hypothetical protein BP01DRAFT_421889 [Aspergillus saccharolyticus JOP 1030-1]PYH47612.1 hypothetical protein BP01DRAFT_421889 [Aspergillus saccharolyticus JOP 1030-1]
MHLSGLATTPTSATNAPPSITCSASTGPSSAWAPNDVDITDRAAIGPIYIHRGGFPKTSAYSKVDIDCLYLRCDAQQRRAATARLSVLDLARAMARGTSTAYLFNHRYGAIAEVQTGSSSSAVSASASVGLYVGVGAFFNLKRFLMGPSNWVMAFVEWLSTMTTTTMTSARIEVKDICRLRRDGLDQDEHCIQIVVSGSTNPRQRLRPSPRRSPNNHQEQQRRPNDLHIPPPVLGEPEPPAEGVHCAGVGYGGGHYGGLQGR